MGQPVSPSGTETGHKRTGDDRPHRSAPLPLPLVLGPARTAKVFYVLSTTDRHGRLADQQPVRALHWSAGRRVSIAASGDAILATADPDGREAITSQGFLRLPAALRHRYRIRDRDRLLVCAFADRGCLAVYTLTVMDEAFATRHAALFEKAVS